MPPPCHVLRLTIWGLSLARSVSREDGFLRSRDLLTVHRSCYLKNRAALCESLRGRHLLQTPALPSGCREPSGGSSNCGGQTPACLSPASRDEASFENVQQSHSDF